MPSAAELWRNAEVETPLGISEDRSDRSDRSESPGLPEPVETVETVETVEPVEEARPVKRLVQPREWARSERNQMQYFSF